MSKCLKILLSCLLVFALGGCQINGTAPNHISSLSIIIDSTNDDPFLQETSRHLQKTLEGNLLSVNEINNDIISSSEFIILGFVANNNVLPENITQFLNDIDLGARTVFIFVIGENNNENAILEAISLLQPGAFINQNILLLNSNDSIDIIALVVRFSSVVTNLKALMLLRPLVS